MGGVVVCMYYIKNYWLVWKLIYLIQVWSLLYIHLIKICSIICLWTHPILLCIPSASVGYNDNRKGLAASQYFSGRVFFVRCQKDHQRMLYQEPGIFCTKWTLQGGWKLVVVGKQIPFGNGRCLSPLGTPCHFLNELHHPYTRQLTSQPIRDVNGYYLSYRKAMIVCRLLTL